MRFAQVIYLFLLLSILLEGRTIKDIKGRSLDVNVLEIEEDRVQVERLSDRSTFWIPLNQLAEEDRQAFQDEFKKANMPSVAFDKVNEVLGITLFEDFNLWDDKDVDVANRILWPRESKTETQSSFRLYPRDEYQILGQRVYSAVFYGNNGKAEMISIVFANKGDLAKNGKLVGASEIEDVDKIAKELKRLIDDVGEQMRESLSKLLGESERAKMGSRDMKESVSRWNWGPHAIMLSEQSGEYVSLKIMDRKLADNKGRYERVMGSDLKKMLLENVVKQDNGDILLKNIPMVDQGPKGYCVPATFERYLRYMGISADMYVLAMAGNTQIGGGTYISDIIEGTESYVSQNGRNLKSVKMELDNTRNIAKHIDDGYPIIWGLFSGKAYNDLTDLVTDAREKKDIKIWAKESEEYSKAGEGISVDRDAGHVCLIIGYNKETNEIAVSDSWGSQYEVRWTPATAAKKVSQGVYYIIDR
jgi:hypothetical protein